MTAVLAPRPVHLVRPYITTGELARAPMALDVKSFLPDDQASHAQIAEMEQVILRASGRIDNYCQQPLYSHIDYDAGRVPLGSDGLLAIPLRHGPVRQVLAVAAGTKPSTVVDLDLTEIEMRPWQIRLPAPVVPGWQRPYATWRYMAGAPVARLTVAAVVGGTALVVDDATGIQANVTQLRVTDGIRTVTITPTAVAGNTLTVPALEFAHDVGTGVSALSEDVKDALLLVIGAGLRVNDSHALTLTRTDRTQGPVDDQRASMLESARELLIPYRRVI